MDLNGNHADLYFAGAEPAELASNRVLSTGGVLVRDALIVTDAAEELTTAKAETRDWVARATTSATQSCSALGVQNVAVLLVTFPGVTLPTGATTQDLNDIFFDTSTGRSLNGFLQEASYGQTSAAGGVFGPFTLTGTYTSCTDVGGAVLNDAIAAATASGVNLNNYSRVFLVFPNTLGCMWGGFANVGGCTISSSSGTFNASIAYLVAGGDRDTNVEYAAHEMGHNLGLLHSGIVTTTNGMDVLGPVTAPGTLWDQGGDYWSTMGEVVLGLYPSPQKAEVLGWLTPTANYRVVQGSGNYTIQPLETAPAGLQALKVQRGTGNNAWLWLEYRQPLGSYDSTLSKQPYSGALIHYEDSNTQLGHTYLPNFTPSDATWWSPALAAGQTWTDPYSNLSISVLSATSSGLNVAINYGTVPCTHANPGVSISPANPSIPAGSIVNYTVSITNNDSTGCTASAFTISSTQPAGWSPTLSPPSVTANPGQTVSTTLSQAIPTGIPAATYTVGSSATNGSYIGSASANCTVTTAPTLTDATSVTPYTLSARQTAAMTSVVMYGNSAASGATVTFNLAKPNGSTVTGTATADSSGKASWSYKVSQKDPTGTYQVTTTAQYKTLTATGTTAFGVQ